MRMTSLLLAKPFEYCKWNKKDSYVIHVNKLWFIVKSQKIIFLGNVFFSSLLIFFSSLSIFCIPILHYIIAVDNWTPLNRKVDSYGASWSEPFTQTSCGIELVGLNWMADSPKNLQISRQAHGDLLIRRGISTSYRGKM